MSGRIRTVKPEWLEDELMAGASDAAARLSIGLILMADDYGNGRASLSFITSNVWGRAMERNGGIDAPEVLRRASDALHELVRMNFATLYEVNQQRYFSIRNWEKHQRVSHKGARRVPEPSSGANVNHIADAGESPESLRNPPEVLVPDLRSPISEKDHRSPITKGGDSPLGRLLDGFRKRWEAHRLPSGAKLGAGWMGPRQHASSAERVAELYASDPDSLDASLDGYFASSDPFVVNQAKWNFGLWVNDPGKWISARVEPAVDIDALLARGAKPITHESDDDGPMVLELPKTPRRARA
jgi:hypothetical protein